MDDSAITKMQLHYWEAKQTFLKKIKRKEDDFVVASDAELDAKLELLKSIDETNQNLLNLLELYQDRVCALAQEECILGRFLRECSKHDTTKAGNLMSGSGKTFLFAGHQFIMLRNVLIRSFRDVQTFQYRAVTDTFDTVEQMEKSRTAYRAALLWMKDVSKQLDPDAYIQMDKFKKIQNHVREKKKVFEKLKIDTIQKIDLLSASRCNLFSNILQLYQNTLKAVWGKTTKTMNIFVDTFKSHMNYEFTMLKELNVDSNVDEAIQNFEEKLKEILAQQNSNEVDMLIFFEADYTDDKDDNRKADKKSEKNTNQQQKHSKQTKKTNDSKQKTNQKNKDIKSTTNSTTTKALLDFNFDDIHQSASQSKEAMNQMDQLSNHLDQLNSFMPSSLIDFDQIKNIPTENNTCFIDKLINSEKQNNFLTNNTSSKQESQESEKTIKPKNSTSTSLDTWLNLFADIDPLSNQQEFEKRFSSDKTNLDDRNC